jgi:bifunctional non-homologous end joining protein LigD
MAPTPSGFHLNRMMNAKGLIDLSDPGAIATQDAAASESRIFRHVGTDPLTVRIGARQLRLTNLDKIFWPKERIRKADLIYYYMRLAGALLPHLRRRAMVMKRYPNGIEGDFFYMKRTPANRPAWLETCAIEHASGSVIEFPVVQDLASLLWIINLGCIDLNPWYSRCDDTDRPDFLHFDLDPVKGDPPVPFQAVREAALAVKEGLEALKIHSLAKSSGSRGLHVYVPVERGPTQKQVWTFAKAFAKAFARQLADRHPRLLTAEYRVAKRPAGRVLVDYNQNAWGRTLASVYSVRPRPHAPVSAPVTWQEVQEGFDIEDFTLADMPERVARLGDLWEPLLRPTGRVRLEANP